MSVFFIPTDNISDNELTITGSDVNHIKNVLRMKVGDVLSCNDSKGIVYNCRIKEFNDSEILLDVLSKEESKAELSLKVSLFQGLPKADKMEMIIQKAVEMGVYDIYPVINERSVVKLDARKASQKTERWQKIAESAAKQSGRAIIPVVHEPVDYKKAVVLAKDEGKEILLPYENAEGMAYSKKVIENTVKRDSCAVFIGPEGGFSEAEVQFAKENDAKIISLGHRILRTETAGLFVMSVLSFECECMND
ncbi:MAG: 16S rRNA (uracil(1498)-N(3))-methyltransferase [Lachnospiraceae bacterium]|nr:16S rRNA (uracil(1498)-N(3))-methyltransferase [Lachnospiraceae bacterium]